MLVGLLFERMERFKAHRGLRFSLLHLLSEAFECNGLAGGRLCREPLEAIPQISEKHLYLRLLVELARHLKIDYPETGFKANDDSMIGIHALGGFQNQDTRKARED